MYLLIHNTVLADGEPEDLSQWASISKFSAATKTFHSVEILLLQDTNFRLNEMEKIFRWEIFTRNSAKK